MAFPKTLPEASPDETPKKIKKAAKTIAMSESAFIFYKSVDLFFNGKNSRGSCGHRKINFATRNFYVRNFV